MQYWIAIALVLLLVAAAVVTRGALPWRRGVVLLSVVLLAVGAVEALVRTGVLAASDAGPAFALIAVGAVLLAAMTGRRGRKAEAPPPAQYPR